MSLNNNRFAIPDDYQEDADFQSVKQKKKKQKQRTTYTAVESLKCGDCGKDSDGADWQEITYGRAFKPLCPECFAAKPSVPTIDKKFWKAKCSACKSTKDLHYLQTTQDTFKLVCVQCLPKTH